jgi:long-subunit fatty acid transport protein
MEKNTIKNSTKTVSILFFMCLSFALYCQDNVQNQKKGEFWNHVKFGGGFGLSLGTGFTDITIAPSAIYNFNNYVSIGAGLQGSLVAQKDYYTSGIYGASLITLFNPIEHAQISLELEQVRVNSTFQTVGGSNIKNNFWNTGLFVGAGYRMDNVTVGVRYNLLFDKDKSVYSDALMPFIRVYF